MAIPWMLIAMGLGGALKLTGGFMDMNAAEKEANAQKEQGTLALYEAAYKARTINEEAIKLQSEQTMKYVMTGVQIAGTPIAVLDDTIRKAKQDIGITMQQAYNIQRVSDRKAGNLKSAGRAKMLGSVADVAFGVFNTLYDGKLLNPTPAPTLAPTGGKK